MRKVVLNLKAYDKYEVIKYVVEGKYNKEKAEIRLGISRRHINRLIKKYKQEGKQAFKHGNTGRQPIHSISSELKENIVKLYIEKYSKFNFTHFTEKLSEIENIHYSRSTIAAILYQHYILSPKARKKTKREVRQQLKSLLETEKKKREEKIIINKLETLDPFNAHPSRPRKKYMGDDLNILRL